MAQFSRTWWGKQFIEALEAFSDPSRLGRGRSYARNGKILKSKIDQNRITAKVKGSINPYFGVYKEPRYNTTIEITPISSSDWSKAIQHLSSKASFVSKLLMNEVPDNIEDVFSDLGLHLLPQSEKDFKTTCSCPDWSNPCKHIAGVYYLVASQLDDDPFLLFQLRGLSKDVLKAELSQSPLGKILSQELTTKEVSIQPSISFYTTVETEGVPEKISAREFWLGTHRLPQVVEETSSVSLPAILIKKQGDFPAFWKKEDSFIQVMEEFYRRVKTKNKNLI
ncbi:SWIM zinc finger family protein [Planktothrix agardhii]|uniref:SWIM zinc finger family protein n=1 Tax=Planktothrix agardhii TaxID=1160 RepID=UPI0003FD1843|nr:SWIM zinc finger family protein [Planktothrix agardhii]